MDRDTSWPLLRMNWRIDSIDTCSGPAGDRRLSTSAAVTGPDSTLSAGNVVPTSRSPVLMTMTSCDASA